MPPSGETRQTEWNRYYQRKMSTMENYLAYKIEQECRFLQVFLKGAILEMHPRFRCRNLRSLVEKGVRNCQDCPEHLWLRRSFIQNCPLTLDCLLRATTLSRHIRFLATGLDWQISCVDLESLGRSSLPGNWK